MAYVFERSAATGQWEETARLTVAPGRSEGTFAASVALDGRRALVTARGALLPSTEQATARSAPSAGATGAAYVFEQHPRTGRWHRVARLTPHRPDPRRAFGGACALDGDRLVVTASPYFADVPGAVYLFKKEPGSDGRGWEQAARLEGFDDFSISVALEGERLLVGEGRAGDEREGAAVLFERTAAGGWAKRAHLRPRTPYREGAFGTAVSLGSGRALVTGYDEQLGLDFNIDRVVYVFERRGDGRWLQRQILDVGDVSFGTAIDHQGESALVGHVSPGRDPGAAYVIGLQ